jgi:hypothetical protein
MTEDQNADTGRPRGGIELPLPGMAEGRAYEDAVEHETVADVDYEDNELHAAGRTCARCGRAIRPEDDVRRTASGAYEHEFCQMSVDPGPVATDR